MTAVVLAGWAAVAVAQLALWWQQRRSGDASIVDVGWSAALVALAAWYAIAGDGLGERRLLVGAMGAVWGGRLAWYLGRRLRRARARHGEDGRYQALRARWGAAAQRNFFLFFQVQAAWSVLFSIPFLIAMGAARPALGWQDLLGVALWAIGVAGESVADAQLARFRADPANAGRTCRVGLWRASRHPNYFFEWIGWWGYVAIAWGAPHGWVALLGPIVMLLFLVRFTGIPYTEAQALRSRGDDYRAYQRTTSAFVPWFPVEDRIARAGSRP
jgi:steroid 5-alpha reductase family enzyme